MANTPSLRFADGGNLITRWARSIMRPDTTPSRLRQIEDAPPPAPAPAPAPVQVVDPSRVTKDNPAGIRFQDGGTVPGKGTGDKIPAKYEPGEFVVSNDMIDDNPGLREELSDMRADTLARRGKTVAEADRGIVTRRGLRAMDGVDVLERPMTADEAARFRPADAAAHADRVNPKLAPNNPAYHGDGRYGVPANPTPATPAASAAPTGRAYAAGNAAGKFLRSAAPVAAIGGAVDGLRTDTEDYAKRFGLEHTEPGLLRDLGVRALGVASDVGNNLTLGLAGNFFRDRQEAPAAAAPAAPATPAAAAPAAPGPAAPGPAPADDVSLRWQRRTGQAPLLTNQPDAGLGGNDSLMGRGPMSARTRAAFDGIQSRQDASDAAAARKAQYDAEVAAAQRANMAGGASTGGFGLLDNDARRERSLRMDAGQLKPGARTALKQFGDRVIQRDALASGERVASAKVAAETATTRRGQDLELQGKREQIAGNMGLKQMEIMRDARLRQMSAALWNQAGGDPETYQNLAMQYGLTDAAKTGGDMAAAVQGRRQSAAKSATGRLESLAAGPDGKLDPNRLAQVRALVGSAVPNFETMTEDEQVKAWPKVLSAVNTVEGMNRLRTPTVMNMVGLEPDAPASMTMPNLRGAKVGEVGAWEGATTPKVSRGDYKITMQDGTVKHIPRESVDMNTLELLKQQGASISTR